MDGRFLVWRFAEHLDAPVGENGHATTQRGENFVRAKPRARDQRHLAFADYALKLSARARRICSAARPIRLLGRFC